MEETSINIQFLKKFFKGLVPNLKELSAHITLAFLTLMYQKNQVGFPFKLGRRTSGKLQHLGYGFSVA